jgi:hypothetical protein
MIYGFLRRASFLLAIVFAAAVVSASAQGKPEPQEDFPKNIKETLIKNRIDREKKDFQELLARGEEAAKLSDEIN